MDGDTPSLPPQLARLKALLDRSATRLCLIYRASTNDASSSLQFLGGMTDRGLALEGFEQLSQRFLPLVLGLVRDNTSRTLGPEWFNPNPVNALGQRLVGFVIATGTTRLAGYVVVVAYYASSEAEESRFFMAVQQVMSPDTLMGDLPAEPVGLAEVLWQIPAAYCMVYRNTSSGRVPQLELAGAMEKEKLTPKEYPKIDAVARPLAARCFRLNQNEIITPKSTASQTLWSFTVGSGPAHDAGYALVLAAWATDKAEIESFIGMLQGIFLDRVRSSV